MGCVSFPWWVVRSHWPKRSLQRRRFSNSLQHSWNLKLKHKISAAFYFMIYWLENCSVNTLFHYLEFLHTPFLLWPIWKKWKHHYQWKYGSRIWWFWCLTLSSAFWGIFEEKQTKATNQQLWSKRHPTKNVHLLWD